MEREDTDVSWYRCRLVDLLTMFSDVGSGNYEPAEGQALPQPVTNYGATGR